MQDSLATTYYLDHDSAEIQDLVSPFMKEGLTDIEKAIKIYELVRDGWKYYPYNISFQKEDYVASCVSSYEKAHCIDKAIILCSCFRAVGIPSKLHFAKVENHIAVERLTATIGTNIMTPHGMVDVFLDGKWLKVSPAFNKELCEKYNVDPLEFDGKSDSVFHEYNREGADFMEYIEDYGSFDDLPFDFLIANMIEHYPMLEKVASLPKVDLGEYIN